MKRSIKLFIGDIVDNMRLAETLVQGMDFDTFKTDKRTNYAVIRCIEIVGEAVKNIPDELRIKYPAVPWKDLAGMRDIIIHFYMGVDFKIVWRVVTERYPVLRQEIERVFSSL